MDCYRLLESNGLKVQWGYESFSATTSPDRTITLPIYMKSTDYFACASFVTSDYTFTGLKILSRSQNSIEFAGSRFSASGTASSFIWFALGQ